MTTLLLLDLDSVLGAWGFERASTLPIPRMTLGPRPRETPDAWLEVDDGVEGPAPAGSPQTVVVVATSGQLAWHFRLTHAYVRRFAARLASLLMAPSPAAAEIALVPSAPGTTRHALLRLCLETSHSQYSIPLERIWTATYDTRLAASLTPVLRPAGKFLPRATGLSVLRLFEREPASGPPWVRRPPPAVSHDPVDKKPPEPTWSAPLDTRARAAGAAERSIDLSPGPNELFQIGAHAENHYPSLFSQIGPTLRTMRGVARLPATPVSTPLLGALDSTEGVEVQAGPPPLLDPLAVSVPCRLGPGAVTFAEPPAVLPSEQHATRERATLRTLLSEHTLAALRAEGNWLPGYGLSPGWLDDDVAIDAMRPYPARDSRGGQVAFRRSSARDLAADAEPLTSGPPRSVWIRGGRAEGTVMLSGWAQRLPPHQANDGRLVVAAFPARRFAASDEIILVSPVPLHGGTARLPRAVGARSLGLALFGAYEVAILSFETPLKSGEVQVVPIQTVDYFRVRWSGASWISPREWEELQRLPVVTPVGPSDGLPTGTGTHFLA